MVLLAIFEALLPVALLLFYILRKDKENPEPTKQLVKASLYGILSAFIAIVFANGLSHLNIFSTPFFRSLYEAFMEAAVPEEGAKLLMLWLLLRKNPYFDEHLDGIVYATCIGLGFAGFENILYLLANLDSLTYVAITRGIFSVPGHFFFAVAMGYFFSLAKFKSKSEKERKNYMFYAFLMPMLFHGVFDALLMLSSSIPAISAILVIVFIYFVNKLFRAGRRRIAELKKMDE